MKVKELIEILNKYKQDDDVYIEANFQFGDNTTSSENKCTGKILSSIIGHYPSIKKPVLYAMSINKTMKELE